MRAAGTLGVTSHGATFLFSAGDGRPILSYRILSITDADGEDVDFKLRRPDGGRLCIEIAASEASYPLAVKAVVTSAVAILHASDPQADDNFAGTVAISGDTIVIGAFHEDGGVGDPIPDAGAVYVFERNQGGVDAWGEVRILRASDPDEGDEFGRFVAIDGDTIAVGASRADGGVGYPADDAGRVYVFDRNEGGENAWGEVAKIRADEGQGGDIFGKTLAIHNDTLVVGAPWEDGGDFDPLTLAGAAYVFARNSGGINAWGEVATLRSSDLEAGDYFGTAVSISNDTIVVTAYGENGGTGGPLPNSGSAYVFERNEGGANAWGEVAVLRASDAEADDQFGASVSIDGNTVVIGASYKGGHIGDPDGNAGAAYVFERNAGGADAWGEVKVLQASDMQPEDLFGLAVSINGDTIIVGAVEEDGGQGNPITNAGASYQFLRDLGGAGNWGEWRILRAPDAQIHDVFGVSVAVHSGTAVVGAMFEDGGLGDPFVDAGAAYVFSTAFAIFADGFESGDALAWSTQVPPPPPTPTPTPTATSTPPPTPTPTPTGTPTVVPTPLASCNVAVTNMRASSTGFTGKMGATITNSDPVTASITRVYFDWDTNMRSSAWVEWMRMCADGADDSCGSIAEEFWDDATGTYTVVPFTGRYARPLEVTGPPFIQQFNPPVTSQIAAGATTHWWAYIRDTGEYVFWDGHYEVCFDITQIGGGYGGGDLECNTVCAEITVQPSPTPTPTSTPG